MMVYDGTSLSELMAPMLKRIVEAALSGKFPTRHIPKKMESQMPAGQ